VALEKAAYLMDAAMLGAQVSVSCGGGGGGGGRDHTSCKWW